MEARRSDARGDEGSLSNNACWGSVARCGVLEYPSGSTWCPLPRRGRQMTVTVAERGPVNKGLVVAFTLTKKPNQTSGLWVLVRGAGGD